MWVESRVPGGKKKDEKQNGLALAVSELSATSGANNAKRRHPGLDNEGRLSPVPQRPTASIVRRDQ